MQSYDVNVGVCRSTSNIVTGAQGWESTSHDSAEINARGSNYLAQRRDDGTVCLTDQSQTTPLTWGVWFRGWVESGHPRPWKPSHAKCVLQWVAGRLLLLIGTMFRAGLGHHLGNLEFSGIVERLGACPTTLQAAQNRSRQF